MNIKEFLIANYIWILVIILLAIVTIIGFLAEKNKSDKKEKKKENVSPQQVSMQPEQAMNNQPNNQVTYQGQVPNQQEQISQVNQMVTPNMQQNNQMEQNVSNSQPTYQEQISQQPYQPQVEPMMMPNQTIPTPSVAEPINSIPLEQNIVQTYQPLSEQTPKFAPQPIPNIVSHEEAITPVMPQPQVQMDLNANMQQPQFVSGQPVQEPIMQTYSQVQPVQTNVMPNGQMSSINQFDNNMMGQPQGTIPQPVIPQNIMQPTQNMGIPAYNNQQMPAQPVLEQQPVNFVFGQPSNNNNQSNM